MHVDPVSGARAEPAPRTLASARAERPQRLTDSRSVLLLVVADVAAVLIAYVLAFMVRIWLPVPLTSELLPINRTGGPHEALLLALTTQIPLLYFFGLYDLPLLRRGLNPTVATSVALAVQLLVITAWHFFRGDLAFPRSVLALFILLNIALVATSRAAARHLIGYGRRALKVALVGPASEVVQVARMLRDRGGSSHTLEVVAALRTDSGIGGDRAVDPSLRWLGGMRELARIAREGGIDQVVVVPAEPRRDDPLDRVLQATEVPLAPEVAVVPSMHELRIGRLASLNIDDIPLIEVARNPQRDVAHAIKTSLDYTLATALLVGALPICAVAAMAIRIDSSGPVFYRQRRVGRGGHEFIMYKFRTMNPDAEDETGPVLARDGDERVTTVGRFLRATRIDELPQLLNVLNGTMSLVGPRPERPEFVEELEREIPGYRERWLVKPGLSGLAQVRGEYHTSPAYKLKYDLAYIHNYSLLLDLRIIAETVKMLLTRRGV